MKIAFSPMRSDATLTLHLGGDVLGINGEDFDLSGIPDGATLPRAAMRCDWLASDVTRKDGELHLTLILPHGPDAPRAVLFPDTLIVTADGPIALPTQNLAEDIQ